MAEPTPQQTRHPALKAPGPLALWGGWLLAAAAWVLHLGVSYGLVEWYCHSDSDIAPNTIYWALNATTVIMAALALAGIALARRNVRWVESAEADSENPASRRSRERTYFMGRAGTLLSLLFLGIILVQGVPNVFLGPCQ